MCDVGSFSSTRCNSHRDTPSDTNTDGCVESHLRTISNVNLIRRWAKTFRERILGIQMDCLFNKHVDMFISYKCQRERPAGARGQYKCLPWRTSFFSACSLFNYHIRFTVPSAKVSSLLEEWELLLILILNIIVSCVLTIRFAVVAKKEVWMDHRVPNLSSRYTIPLKMQESITLEQFCPKNYLQKQGQSMTIDVKMLQGNRIKYYILFLLVGSAPPLYRRIPST